MRCPVCNFYDTKVVDSRLLPEGLSIRRRRECEKCQFRFSTLEDIELLDLTVVKHDGTREAYDRGKIETGLHKALEKRPYTAENFQLLLHAIERDIQKRKKREITTQDIGEIVMNRLKGFDKIAYIRFASVYRSFEDVETFQKELGKLLSGKSARRAASKRHADTRAAKRVKKLL
ncbi:MAG: transcriptional repressor NrdR [Candidatus Magasanikbacteria bacterium]|nr:transcriptional repressor NrdR [Candidatus Magasanikbacteria bacterium]